MAKSEPNRLFEGQHLRLVSCGHWEFTQRTKPSGVVCVVAVTDDNELLLVEQFRPPLGARVIELPAGLAGDVDDADESFETAARRELMEETGYEAADWTRLCDVASSAGLTDEIVTVFRARQLSQTGPGGGDDSEEIQIHTVELEALTDWLAEALQRGRQVDSRVYAAPTFLGMECGV